MNPNHFARFCILDWLWNVSQKKGPSGYIGYFQCKDLFNDLCNQGIEYEIIKRETEYLVAAGCILTENLQNTITSELDLITLSPSGHMHLEIHGNENYLAACAEDTWLSDESLARNLLRLIGVRKKNGQTVSDTATVFKTYLTEEWKKNFFISEMGNFTHENLRPTPPFVNQ